MLRLFVGLELPMSIRQKLLQLQGGVTGARWQSAQQLHLTVCFIGKADKQRTAAVCDQLQDLDHPAFEIELAGVGCFGRAQQPRALWAGVKPRLPLQQLHDLVAGRLQAIHLDQAQAPFRPHITLARFRTNAGPCQPFLDRNADLRSPGFKIDELCLFSSTPGHGGSQYDVLARFPLAGKGAATD